VGVELEAYADSHPTCDQPLHPAQPDDVHSRELVSSLAEIDGGDPLVRRRAR
jgi:hypothetical protein